MDKGVYIQGFWERLDEAVAQSGKSKVQIAQQIGCERKALIRSGHNRMLHSGYLARFCAVTGVSSDWMLGLSNLETGGD